MVAWIVQRGVVSDKTFKAVTLVEVPGLIRRTNDATFYPGDVIESDKDLSLPQHCGRFSRANGAETPPLPINDKIGDMSIAELRALAEREEINLGDTTLKADIAAIVRREIVNSVLTA